MYQRILVPFDGSQTSNRGLDEAIRLATLMGARLRLLHMIEVLLVATGFETAAAYVDQTVPLLRQAGERLLREGQARAERAGVSADTVLVDNLRTGLSDAIADQVTAWGADLIVIGTHGRRGVGRLLLGSDAEQVVRCATVPVLLVKAPPAAAAAAAVTVPADADASIGAAAHQAPSCAG